MSYEETIRYLFESTPVFERSGASAYKPGLTVATALDNHFGNPHQAYKTVHVAGTNGKGSVCHLLAAILQQSGYKVGLYTSPHLVDFRERIRVNGQMIPKDYVVDFVAKHKDTFEPLHPSFFELTSAMAFACFRDCNVDYAVIETGLGGRLDSTNIITPVLSIITNISIDHTRYLGETLPAIAAEKAGIIKPSVPVVIGDITEAETPDVLQVFRQKAAEAGSPICFSGEADDAFYTNSYGTVESELSGTVQAGNRRTVLAAVGVLRECGAVLSPEAVREGFAHVTTLTGLAGRWQQIHSRPKVICDTGHNAGAWAALCARLESEHAAGFRRIHIVAGFSADKDIETMLAQTARLPQAAVSYYFTQAATPRALPAAALKAAAARHGLTGDSFPAVADAVRQALLSVKDPATELIFIGGSNFVVAEALPLFTSNNNNSSIK